MKPTHQGLRRVTVSAKKAHELHHAFALLLASLLRARGDDSDVFDVTDAQLEWAYSELETFLNAVYINNKGTDG